MKGQSELITAVLIGGIVIFLVTSAYMWGLPLIQKQSSITENKKTSDFMLNLYDKVKTMAESCTETCTETVELLPGGRFEVVGYAVADENNNSITFETGVVKSIFTENLWVPLNTGDMNAVTTYDQTTGVLMAKTERAGSGDYTILYKMWFREKDTVTPPYRGYKIELVEGTVDSATHGRVALSYEGRLTNPDGRTAENGGDLEVVRIRVNFV